MERPNEFAIGSSRGHKSHFALYVPRFEFRVPRSNMTVHVQFWSYFKDLAGCADATATLSEAATIADLLRDVYARFPKLAAAEKSTLIAVGVDYQPRTHQLKDGDEVSLFPPVQGG